MKKGTLINSDLSHQVALLGHNDEITICDAGLPIPSQCRRIDLAVSPGIPGFMDTLKAVLSEMQLESVTLAEEFPKVSPSLHGEFLNSIQMLEQESGRSIPVNYISHEAFKEQTKVSKAVVRTGEFTPYANVILKAGVVF